MKESYRKGSASHPGPESCVGRRKAAGEALTGVHVGPVLSCEIKPSRAPTLLLEAEGNTGDDVTRESSTGPAQSETRSMRENSLHGTREVPQAPADGEAGRSGKVDDQTPDMSACGKSDGCVVPKKPPNKGGGDPPGGGGGGKAADQGEHATDGHAPDTAPDQRADRAGACARGSATLLLRQAPEVGAV